MAVHYNHLDLDGRGRSKRGVGLNRETLVRYQGEAAGTLLIIMVDNG